MINMIYAKSNPVETLKEHTDKVLENYEIIKDIYKDKIDLIGVGKDFWEIFKDACFYHDFGKVYTPFQNEIRKKIDHCQVNTKFKNDIPHGYISPAFMDSQEIIAKYGYSGYKILVQAIVFHHERDFQINDSYDYSEFCKILTEDLTGNLDLINNELNACIKKINCKYFNLTKQEARIKENNSEYKKYIMVKGLLQRIDHSASANVCAEIKSQKNISDAVQEYIKEKLKSDLRDLQLFCLNNREKNIIITASTGIGKTESALLWIGDNKAFFTLPLRVSINAIYKRLVDNIKYEDVGLLHSTSYDFLLNEGDENYLGKYEISRQLSYPLNVSTIDQLFTFPFKYRGYEKILATLSYSKIIIDEIQAYSPNIIAVILRGIVMLNNMGAKFLVMTATLPQIVKEYLEEKNVVVEYKTYCSQELRHKLCIKESEIIENLEYIVEKAKNNKILIIVNTISRAKEIYNRVKMSISRENIDFEVNLLHSLFIQKDRFEKENRIKNYNRNGIWITTQIAEASLDIDFDILFTELSTVDSLFQRMGRCYRKRRYEKEEPNVYVYCKNSSGIGSIYDKDIYERSNDELQQFDNKFISEEEKMAIVRKIYSRNFLENTKYLEEFDKSLNFLEFIFDYDLDKDKAQKSLRDFVNVKVIPYEIYEENRSLIQAYNKESNYVEKKKILSDIKLLTLDIPIYKAKGNIKKEENGFFVVNFDYNQDIGLNTDLNSLDFI